MLRAWCAWRAAKKPSTRTDGGRACATWEGWEAVEIAMDNEKHRLIDGWNPTHRNGDEWGWFMTLLYQHYILIDALEHFLSFTYWE